MTPKLVAVSEGEIPEEAILGRIAFFSLPDDPMPADELLRLWTENGLDEDMLPDVRQPVHVFQSACASVKSRSGSGNGRVEVRADEVENSSKRCSYQITRVVWDLDHRVIEHEKALRLEFDKTQQRISSERLDQYDPALEDLERQVRAHYEANMSTVPGPKVRNAIRAVLVDCGSQNLRRKAGGVYFVPREIPGTGKQATDGTPTKPLLDGMSVVLETLYGERGDLYTIPCVNGEGERQMLRKHVALNIKDQAQKVVEKAFTRLKDTSDRAPRKDFVDNLYSERRKLMQGLDHFKQLISLEEGDVAQSLKELDQALEKLDDMMAGA